MMFLVCMDDVEPPLRFSRDLRQFRIQQAYHRMTNESVFIAADGSDPDKEESAFKWGVDVHKLIGSADYDISTAIEEAIERDSWVTRATALVTKTYVDSEVSYDIRVTIETGDDKDLELRVKASANGVSLQ